VLDGFVRLFEHLTNFQVDTLKVGLKQSEVRMGQGREKLIFRNVVSGGNHGSRLLLGKSAQISLSRLRPGFWQTMLKNRPVFGPSLAISFIF